MDRSKNMKGRKRFEPMEEQKWTNNAETRNNNDETTLSELMKRSKLIEQISYSSEVCVYCLEIHNGKKCNKQLCRWCNDIGHASSKCNRLSDPDRITLCKCYKNTYHSVNDCPSVWRKYKLKRPLDLSSIIKSCSNCSSTKHFTNDCVKEQNKFSILILSI
ncbi:Protein AIR2 [Nosema bombycis CQ1]|uniref:Protein AIR2 n=1 Tax=Nosema bombycis (strain CQ1 / CVCC 102059) TaxID=578461 RepID=R0KR09_NOSB1|nr:Protein AIR2 [Nosema bombycis CQ1]|eukprot:EOB13171.1 Protein AIR2 [Nosema bombycis CQ1]